MTCYHIDHLLFGTPDLDQGIETIQARLGVQPAYGGQHPGIGTHNALVALGTGTYLEIIAPDPKQNVPASRIPYGLAQLEVPRLITWAVRPHNWDTYQAQLATLGLTAAVRDRDRTRPDGERLAWRSVQLPSPAIVQGVDVTGLIPFALVWQTAAHPSATAPGELDLQSLTLQHPDLAVLQHVATAMDLPVRTEQTAQPGLVAMIRTPAGIVLLT